MLSEEQIRNQIYQFLSDKDLSDKERAGFLVAAVDIVRKRFALEVENSLTDKDVKDIEKIPSDQEAMAEMVKRFEKNTGKKSEETMKEFVLQFYNDFLAVKDKLLSEIKQPQPK